MIAPTHAVTAQTAYLVVCLFNGHAPTAGEAIASMAASQIPDLDSPTSYIGRVIPPVSGWIEHRFGHRGLTHSALFAVVLCIAAWIALPGGYAIAISAGLLSHSLIDMATKGGVCWFWPSLARCVLPADPAYRMEVGSYAEIIFLCIMGLIGAGLMPLAETGKGPSGLIRTAIGSLSAARQEFDGSKGDWAYRLDLKGRNNKTYADVSGAYPVIGPWADTGFLLRTDTGAVTICGSTTCDWYADSARLQRERAQQTTSYQFDRGQITAADLAAALRPLSAAGEVYLLGTLQAQGAAADPPLVSFSADGNATLTYANPTTIDAWAEQARNLRAVHLTIQLRHDPDTAAPELQAPEDTPTRPAPSLIDRWLPPEAKP